MGLRLPPPDCGRGGLENGKVRRLLSGRSGVGVLLPKTLGIFGTVSIQKVYRLFCGGRSETRLPRNMRTLGACCKIRGRNGTRTTSGGYKRRTTTICCAPPCQNRILQPPPGTVYAARWAWLGCQLSLKGPISGKSLGRRTGKPRLAGRYRTSAKHGFRRKLVGMACSVVQNRGGEPEPD